MNLQELKKYLNFNKLENDLFIKEINKTNGYFQIVITDNLKDYTNSIDGNKITNYFNTFSNNKLVIDTIKEISIDFKIYLLTESKKINTNLNEDEILKIAINNNIKDFKNIILNQKLDNKLIKKNVTTKIIKI